MKTALYYLLREMAEEERQRRKADIAASYREAIVSALVQKTLRPRSREGARTVAVAGGVAANSLLRRRLVEEGEAKGLHVVVPPFAYCTDNAAMIGAAALAGPCCLTRPIWTSTPPRLWRWASGFRVARARAGPLA